MEKVTASSLLAKCKQVEEDAAAIKDYWAFTLPCEPLPDFELRVLIRRFGLQLLATYIDKYAEKAVKVQKAAADGKPVPPITARAAEAYICACVHNEKEAESPDVQRPPTERRRRHAMATLERPHDFDAWHDGTDAERQKAMGTHIATEKAKPRRKKKGSVGGE